ncbi:MAG TPA: hypothetical protein VM866_08785 [Pyrinomonadaceae bacterium]|jgi:hypothetical protein|nr:hypothetical protein [Pyrinomonadaceae bacterium]
MELLQNSGIIAAEKITGLQQEARELVAILVTIARKVKHKT